MDLISLVPVTIYSMRKTEPDSEFIRSWFLNYLGLVSKIIGSMENKNVKHIGAQIYIKDVECRYKATSRS